MKKVIILIFYFCCCTISFGQTSEEIIVQQFGNYLSSWCSSNDTDYRMRAQKQCTDACRVKDKIMEDFVSNSGLNIKDYVVPNYLNGFEDALGKGSVTINISNIRTIYKSEQSYAWSYKTSVNQQEKRSKDFVTVACDIRISGVLDYRVKDLYYIKKGKIVKIAPYVEETDQKTGKKRVRVDFSDLDDEYQTFGATYNYGKNWPIGLSLNYSYTRFMIGLDVGVNTDKDKFYKHSLEMTDVMNFSKEDIEYDPLFYMTLTPSFYMKYFAVGCGAGFLYLNGTKTINHQQSSSFSSGSDGISISGTSSSGYSTEESCPKLKFMVRPTVKGFIPVSDQWFVSVSVGYDYVFGYKDKNGINFGLGLQYNFDY